VIRLFFIRDVSCKLKLRYDIISFVVQDAR
jgi:hypothetical protein